MSSKADRDARLDALVAATDSWVAIRTKELEDRVASSKRILKGRTGAERINSSLVEKGSALVVDAIKAFLIG